MGEVPDHVAHFKTIRFQSTITANETKIALHLRFERPVPFNEQSAASESFLSTSRDHHTKRKKSYAKIENSKGQSPRELAGVSTNEVEVKGYQITSCRKKGALTNELLRRRLGSKRLRRGLNVRFFPIFRVPEYSELLIRTDSRSRWNQERGVAELGIFLAANLAPAVEAYCSSAKFESVSEDARISRGSCSNQGTGAVAHSDSEFPNALIEGRRCAARPFSPRFNIPSPSE
jgi:hypothetical protein